jgi:hypothetical protein
MGDTRSLLQLVDGFARFIDVVKRVAAKCARLWRTKKGAASPEAAPFARGR